MSSQKNLSRSFLGDPFFVLLLIIGLLVCIQTLPVPFYVMLVTMLTAAVAFMLNRIMKRAIDRVLVLSLALYADELESTHALISVLVHHPEAFRAALEKLTGHIMTKRGDDLLRKAFEDTEVEDPRPRITRLHKDILQLVQDGPV